MKLIWNLIAVLAIANLLGIVGFVGYLFNTDHLDQNRVQHIREMLSTTITEEAATTAATQEDARIKAEENAYLVSLDDPSEGVEERTQRIRRTDEVLLEQRRRFEQDRKNIERIIEARMNEVESKWDELIAARTQFRDEVERQRQLVEDEQFQKTVDILKGLSGEDLKGKVDALLADGQIDYVVDLLNAFDKRSAQKLMKEYQSQTENKLAADLLMRLKERGISPAAS